MGIDESKHALTDDETDAPKRVAISRGETSSCSERPETEKREGKQSEKEDTRLFHGAELKRRCS